MSYSTSILGTETGLITLIESQLNLPSGQDTTLLQMYCTSARAFLESFLNRALIRQTVTMRLDDIRGKSFIEARLTPINTIEDSITANSDVSVLEIADDGTETDISECVKYVDTDSQPNRIYMDIDYDYGTEIIGYKVVYTAGQHSIENNDDIYINALVLIVAEMYSNRENPSRQWQTLAEKILSPFRLHYYE